MKPGSSPLWIVAAVAVSCLGAGARADDLGVAAAPPKAAALSSKVDQQIDQAVEAGSGASSDLEARVRDLDATRTAIDQKRPPTISLGVSGWINEETQYNIKQ